MSRLIRATVIALLLAILVLSSGFVGVRLFIYKSAEQYALGMPLDALETITSTNTFPDLFCANGSQCRSKVVELTAIYFAATYGSANLTSSISSGILAKYADEETNSNYRAAFLLKAMRSANSVGEYGLAHTYYLRAASRYPEALKPPEYLMLITAENDFSKVMEVLPLVRKYRLANRDDLEKTDLWKVINNANASNKTNISAICRSRNPECAFLQIRHDFMNCSLKSELDGILDMPCIRNAISKIYSIQPAGQGVDSAILNAQSMDAREYSMLNLKIRPYFESMLLSLITRESH